MGWKYMVSLGFSRCVKGYTVAIKIFKVCKDSFCKDIIENHCKLNYLSLSNTFKVFSLSFWGLVNVWEVYGIVGLFGLWGP